MKYLDQIKKDLEKSIISLEIYNRKKGIECRLFLTAPLDPDAYFPLDGFGNLILETINQKFGSFLSPELVSFLTSQGFDPHPFGEVVIHYSKDFESFEELDAFIECEELSI